MKSSQNKMDNSSSCSTNKYGTVRNNSNNSTTDNVRNQGDLREIRNQGDLRDVAGDGGANKDQNKMTIS